MDIDNEIYKRLKIRGLLPDKVRDHNVGESDYSAGDELWQKEKQTDRQSKSHYDGKRHNEVVKIDLLRGKPLLDFARLGFSFKDFSRAHESAHALYHSVDKIEYSSQKGSAEPKIFLRHRRDILALYYDIALFVSNGGSHTRLATHHNDFDDRLTAY